MRQALAAGVAYAITALARDAHASEVALDYDAPSACPSEASFVADVRARLADRAVTITDDRRFRVRITEERGSYRGALETLDPPSVRDVGGETCEEVVRALVVFVALALSPAEVDDPPTSAPPPQDEAPPAQKASPLPDRPAPAPPDGQPERPRAVVLGADIRGLAIAGVMPGIVPGGALAARLVVRARPSWRWFVHAGGLVAHHEERVLAGAFTFSWSAARLDAGLALDVGVVRVSAGPAIRAGVLSVAARDLPSAAQYKSFWGDLGGFARLDWPVADSFGVSVMVELAAPFQRRTFGIQGIDEPVHEIAPVIGVGSLGVTFGQ